MEVLVERCAGLDVGKADLKACVRVPGPRGGRRQQIKTFAATTGSLLRLRDWLMEQHVTVVGMEATGDYWKPVYHVLEDAVEVQLLNAAHMHNVPGRKSDVSDSAWIARLAEHGLVRASFVPPRPIRRLREPIADRLDTIPGVNQRVAQVITAEIGVDMAQFPTAAHLASWAGMCPGTNESAGKHFSGRTRKGDRWLRAALGEAAAAAAGTKDTYRRAQYHRLAARRGKKRALVAVGHSLLVAAWHVINDEVSYQDLGALHFLTRIDPARQTRRLVAHLQQLGYQVRLSPAASG
jgi:transposase